MNAQRSFSLSAALALAGVTLFVGACSEDRAAASGDATDHAALDQPLAGFRVELLDLAYRAASKFPLDPHIKNRSRAQEAVVDACLELEQPERAQRCIEGIANWRRGAGYADLACYCIEHRATADVPHYLELATHIAAETAEDPNEQEWRPSAVRARIAKAHLLLGHADEARRVSAGVDESQAAVLGVAEALLLPADAFARQTRAYDEVLANGSFDQVQNVLRLCATLFDRFYDDTERRAVMQERVQKGFGKLPVQIRIELLTDLAEAALRHGDGPKATELVGDAQALLDDGTWLPENRIPIAADLAAVRFRAGGAEQARRDLRAAEVSYDEARSRIVDIERAGPLRAIAEAHAAIGDVDAAREAYARAVEEGVGNPNSRPRADDLVATAISMAVHDVAPDAALRQRMLEIRDGLGDPW